MSRIHKERRYPEQKPAVKKHGGRVRKHQRADILTVQGEVLDALGYDNYRVELDNGVTILATLSGRMRKNYIRVVVGDRVELELSAYDLTRGRITRRYQVKQDEYGKQ